MAAPPTIFPKLVWNRDAQGGRYSPLDGDGKGHPPAKPEEHRDYESEQKGRPHREGDGPRQDEGIIPGDGKGAGKPVPEIDPSTAPPPSKPGA